MSEQDTAAGAGAEAGERRLQLHKIYLKDASFESPAAPGIFSESADMQPQVGLQLNTETQLVGGSVYDVTLAVTVTGEAGERTIFLAEVKQAGLFELAGYGDEERDQLLGTYCPSVLFPFAREVISELVRKGGMPQLVLQPINFDALYARYRKQQQSGADGAGTEA